MYIVYRQREHLRVVVEAYERVGMAYNFCDQLAALRIKVEVDYITQYQVQRNRPVKQEKPRLRIIGGERI